MRARRWRRASTVAPYSPLYYAVVAPAYLAASGQSIWSQLTLLRLHRRCSEHWRQPACSCSSVNWFRAPMGGRRGGLLVALQRCSPSCPGSSTTTPPSTQRRTPASLLVRAVRRGLTVGRAASIGVVIAILPFAKGSASSSTRGGRGARRDHLERRRERRLHALVAVAVMAVALSWRPVSAERLRPRCTTTASDPLGFVRCRAGDRGTSPARTGPAGKSPTRAIDHPGAFLSYTWQLFLPRLPFHVHLKPAAIVPAFQIYVERAGHLRSRHDPVARWAYALILPR